MIKHRLLRMFFTACAMSSYAQNALAVKEMPGLSYQLHTEPAASQTDAASPTNATDIAPRVFQTPDALAALAETTIAAPAKEPDLWVRIRNGYAIPDLENELTASHTNWYSNRANHIKITVARGSRYLYHVVEELEKRHMPTELALLPFIESAFNPQATSSAKASGMWQFMPATGRDFNLKQTMFKDDRRGVLDSTDAALTYLQRLYVQFGDWQLALAAYNWGEGSVQRAIKKQQALGLPIDFESLSTLMPVETKNYFPKLQAIKNIIRNPEQHDISLPKLDNQPYFVTVEKNRDIDVDIAARLAELSVTEFTALNPQFNRPIITSGSAAKILLPVENAALFNGNFAKWKGPLCTWTAYIVNKTEKLEALAKRLGLKAQQLRDINLIPSKMLVKSGSTILIPKSAKAPDQDIVAEIVDKAQLMVEKEAPLTRQITYKVGRRDNLAGIAKRFKVGLAQIKGWNNLKRDSVSAGQILEITVPISYAKMKNLKPTLAEHKKSDQAKHRTVVANVKLSKRRG